MDFSFNAFSQRKSRKLSLLCIVLRMYNPALSSERTNGIRTSLTSCKSIVFRSKFISCAIVWPECAIDRQKLRLKRIKSTLCDQKSHSSLDGGMVSRFFQPYCKLRIISWDKTSILKAGFWVTHVTHQQTKSAYLTVWKPDPTACKNPLWNQPIFLKEGI